jgi:hemerythrin
MEWDPALETGERTIDDQHMELMRLFNELDQAERQDGPEEVRRVLDALIDYTSVHFSMEEDLMRREHYPAEDLESHKAEHRDLTARTREMVLDYRTGQLASVEPLTAFLRDWLTHHIDERDRLLADHLRARRG